MRTFMLRYVFLTFGLFLATNWANAAIERGTLATPRNALVPILYHVPTGRTPRAVLIVGAGQDCGEALGPLYETLAAQAEARGFAVVRFQWAYCQSFNGQNGPSQGLRNEIEDYETVWDFTRLNPGKFGNRIFVTGKALGGIVANAVLRGHNDLKGALFLAPICSLSADENGNPLPQPLPVAEQNYFGIKQERRPALFLSGKQDPLCNQTIMSEFLRTAPRNVSKVVVLGDNDLRVLDHTGSEDSVGTKRNISNAVQLSLDWLERALGQHLGHFN